MFNSCKKMINLDLSSFNTNNVNEMNYYFDDCKNLNKVKIYEIKNEKILNQIKENNFENLF